MNQYFTTTSKLNMAYIFDKMISGESLAFNMVSKINSRLKIPHRKNK